MTLISHMVTLVMVVLLHLWSPVGVLNALAPQAGVAVARDVAYAAGPRHGLDIYAPRPAATPAPVVVFFYGGGWTSGEKAMYRFVAAGLAARGVLVVIPDYRLAPAVQFPAMMDDAAAAVAWTHANIARYGGDPHRLFLMGHSPGGQIAALLALDGRYLASVGLPPPGTVCGVIGLGAPYDFLPLLPGLQAVFGSQADWAQSQPINFASAAAPPMLLMAGTGDRTIDPANTQHFAARLRANGASVQDALYWGVSHRALVMAFGEPLAFLAPVRDATLRFVEAHPACDGGPAQWDTAPKHAVPID